MVKVKINNNNIIIKKMYTYMQCTHAQYIHIYIHTQQQTYTNIYTYTQQQIYIHT